MATESQLKTKEEQIPRSLPNSVIDDDSIVISGMAGMFPMSNHVKGFSENLYNKVYTVTDTLRFKRNHPELHNYGGIIPDLEPFDAQFFGVHAKLSSSMDSMSRKLLEQTYQAIFDAGLSIDHVRNSRLGVFIGSCFSETEKACFYVAENRSGFGIMGCCKAMFANRISYWLDAKGPSMSLDAMCSSSIVALKHAVEAIRSGECDAAVVGSANICLHPQSSILYGRAMQMSPDGKVRSLCKDADGTVRSEAINVLFLQKAKYAKRSYSQVCHVECNFAPNETKSHDHLRSIPQLKDFYKEFYQKANVPPNEVEYIETFGIGIAEVDKNELETIGEVFCKDRNEPLLVGSVMSNMGYTEAASGISSIIKVCLAYHTGEIAANLHCDNPRDDIEALRDGRMKIVNTHTPTNYSYCAVNNFSIGGLNGHVLLKGYYNDKKSHCYQSSMPYLLNVSGRHEEAVKAIVDEFKSHPIDPEQIALLQNVQERATTGHLTRGYCIITPQEDNKTKLLTEKIDYYGEGKRPIWFVYSGMGSQWATMGAELMRIPIFAAAIERCRKVLQPLGVDIVDVITNSDKKMFDNILNSFVGIAAVQIGLTDILQELGIVPDKIIGHSVGELGCAYADGCFTAEEMILAAYSRGLVSVETPFIHGSMAAVGLGFNTVSKMCPPEIEVACHNSAESSTISGPSDVMKEFVGKLTAQGIFAKEVPCSNIAYHSRYIAEAGPKLKEHLLKVISDPKPRSDKWLSTSVQQDKWHLESAQFSSAEYHTNNLLSPVLFEEISRLIPHNAVTIEIAPHGLLQAILKRSLNAGCTNIALTRRGHSDPLTFLLTSIGDMFMIGLNPKLQCLYPKINYPVSTGTDFLSHMVKWVHTESWPLPIHTKANTLIASQRNFVLSIFDDEQKYLDGHVIEGHVTYPLSALLVIVWETYAMSLQTNKEELLVEFRDVHYYHDVFIRKNDLIRLAVTIQKGSGKFEVSRANIVLIEGTVLSLAKVVSNAVKEAPIKSSANYELDSEDIYKILFKKGYYYKDSFKSIKKSDLQFTNAEVTWNNNWVTFIDSLFQLNVLNKEHDGVSKLIFIRSLVIDSMKQSEYANYSKDLEASINALDIAICGGVIMQGIKFICRPPNTFKNVLKRIEFMPFLPIGNVNLDTILHAQIQLVSENITGDTINAVNIINAQDVFSVGDKVKNISNEIFDVNMDLKNITKNILVNIESFESIHLIIGFNLVKTLLSVPSLKDIVPDNVFILNVSKVDVNKEDINKLPITIISTGSTEYGFLTLMRWQPVLDNCNVTCISIDNDYKLLHYTRNNLTEKDRLIVTTKYPATDELKDLIKKWKKGNEKNKVHLYMSDNKMLSDEHFFEAARKGLTFNVSVNGIWGSEFYLPLENNSRSFTDLKLVNNGHNLDSLEWVQIDNVPNNGVNIKVHYAGVNYYDAQKATGLIPCLNNDEITFGMDFSGLTVTGQRVMGVVKSGSLTTSVNTDPNLLWPVPEHWSLEDAATVPFPYLHAFYCLVTKGEITPEQTVVIHGGAGALGQAVISIALSMGCTVYATVSNVQKKKFLLRLFPELSEKNIGNSKNESFQEMVLEGTKGEGCNIFINCLKGNFEYDSNFCVGLFGKFIDINLETTNNSPLQMSVLALDRSHSKINFQHILEESNAADLKKLHRLVTEGIIKGYVRPLTRVTYSPTETERAFRLLKGSNHRGRVLLRMHEEAKSLSATQSLSCSPEKSYVILCGKQDFGLDVVDRIVLRNARKLTIHCDPSFSVGLLQRYVKSWQCFGVQVKINTTSLNVDDNHTDLIKDSLQMGQVEGIIIVGQYDKSIVDAIEKTSRKLCLSLKYFALLKVGKEKFDVAETNILKDRSKNNLPTVLLQLPTLHMYDTADTYKVPQTIHSALNAIETALSVKQHVPISTYSVGKTDVDVLQDISVLLGINIPNTLRANTTLRELGVNDEGMQNVISYLEKTFNLSFHKEDMPDFTISTLMNIPQLSRNKQNVKEEKDLSIFFTNVDPEEIEATVDIILMSTTALNRPQESYEFDCEETYMVIIPGMEGHYGMFQTLCERLKIPAVVLLPPLEYAFESIPDVANRLIKVVKKKININGKRFYICGYSFGAIVGLEMAAMLESQGFEGTVFCLDSAPDVYKKQLANVIGDMSEEQLQNTVIEHMFTLMSNAVVENLKEDLQNASTWKDKLDICKRHLRGRVPHSTQYANLLIESAYGRICSSRSYTPTKLLSSTKLDSQVILLKGLVPKELGKIPFDFGLSNYTKTAPVVYQLGSSHRYLPNDLGCSSIINRHLDEDILEGFAKRNLCDTYFLSGQNSFMHF